MAPLTSLGALLSACLFVLASGIGLQILGWVCLEIENEVRRMLVAVALGMVILEVAFFFAQLTGKIEAGVVATLVMGVGFVAGVRKELSVCLAMTYRRVLTPSKSEMVLMAATLAIVVWEGLAATAPRVGSDALNYHFTVPFEVLRNGFKPDFFLTHAFLVGQSHSLVLAGLSLGSEKLALALVWLGGVLTAVTAASIGRQWLSRRAAWLVMLAFLLNPIVFWQLTSAGSPDLWMGIFLGAGVLLLSEASKNISPGIAVAGGILAGGLAGAKYTGCIFAGILLLVFVVETRSIWKAAVFSVTAAVAGCWPYLRNLRWTGDPVFPYALSWFAPEKINRFALAAIRDTTGAEGHRDALRLIKFLFFAAWTRSISISRSFLARCCWLSRRFFCCWENAPRGGA